MIPIFKAEQQIFRVYPHDWTPNRLEILNELLRDGWKVVSSNPISGANEKGIIYDYILERSLKVKQE